MESDELMGYWASHQITLFTLNTQIDFDDLDHPLKTQFKSTEGFQIDPNAPTKAKSILMKKNVFYDNTDRLQLGDSAITTTYLNQEKENETLTFYNPNRFMEIQFCLHELESVQQRVAYSFLNFLGDLGGTFASVTFLGYAVHFLITG